MASAGTLRAYPKAASAAGLELAAPAAVTTEPLRWTLRWTRTNTIPPADDDACDERPSLDSLGATSTLLSDALTLFALVALDDATDIASSSTDPAHEDASSQCGATTESASLAAWAPLLAQWVARSCRLSK